MGEILQVTVLSAALRAAGSGPEGALKRGMVPACRRPAAVSVLKGRMDSPAFGRVAPFRNSTKAHAPQASILFDKLHVLRHLGEALDEVRKSEYARLSGKDRRFIKGRKYTLLSRRENLTLEGRQALR